MPLEIEIINPHHAQPEETYAHATWRLVTHPARDGGWNMAVDEAILEALSAGRSQPTLRFFAWEPACLSLGQAQHYSDVDAGSIQTHGWDVVRRITGGRAILHTDELTYSLAALENDLRVKGGVVESYRRLSRGLLAGLHHLGAGLATNTGASGPAGAGGDARGPVCFEVPSDYEITADGKKLLGSAQTRRKGVVLQHGTLPLAGDIARICDALVFADEGAREMAKQRVRTRAATLSDVLGMPVDFEQAARALRHGFGEALNLDFAPGDLSAWEQTRAEQLYAEKYTSGEWTRRH